jgi:hypothetical protein
MSQLQAQLPWLAGTFGTVSLDAFIFWQVCWIINVEQLYRVHVHVGLS